MLAKTEEKSIGGIQGEVYSHTQHYAVNLEHIKYTYLIISYMWKSEWKLFKLLTIVVWESSKKDKNKEESYNHSKISSN